MNKRFPCQVSSEFKNKLKKIQKELYDEKGKLISEREITKLIADSESFTSIEKEIVKKEIKDVLKMDRRMWK